MWRTMNQCCYVRTVPVAVLLFSAKQPHGYIAAGFTREILKIDVKFLLVPWFNTAQGRF